VTCISPTTVGRVFGVLPAVGRPTDHRSGDRHGDWYRTQTVSGRETPPAGFYLMVANNRLE
jgi:hypothetical protein